jgi:outer membrane lipoprotein SlyB
MRRGLFIALMLVVTALTLGGCGDSGSSNSNDPARAALKEAEAVVVGRSIFVKLRPGALDAKQRRILAYITGGRWLQNGLFILAKQAEANCRAKLLSEETCEALP